MVGFLFDELGLRVDEELGFRAGVGRGAGFFVKVGGV